MGGTGRSGTKLLRRLVGRHPDVFEAPEWRFMIDPGGLVDFYASLDRVWSPLIFDRRYKELERLLHRVADASLPMKLYTRLIKHFELQRFFGRSIIPAYAGIQAELYCPGFNELVKELLLCLKEFDFPGRWVGSELFSRNSFAFAGKPDKALHAAAISSFFRQVVARSCQASGKRFFLEKNTWNILLFDKIRELLPEAKLVHIYRDPRDVVCSFINQDWTPKDPLQAARYFSALMDHWLEVRKALPEDSYVEVCYERLVSDPAETLEKVGSFFGLDPRFFSQPDSMGGISSRSLGRWKDDLDETMKEQVNFVLKKYISLYGYDA